MLKIGQLEPFALLTLAGGLLYSIVILTIESKANSCYRIHFVILTLVIFVALLVMCVFKYLKYRFACRQVEHLLKSMKTK